MQSNLPHTDAEAFLDRHLGPRPRDVDAMVEGMADFVDRFNESLNTIDDLTSFNPDTKQRGLLLGDSTVNLIRSRLQRLPLRSFAAGAGSFSRLTAVGIRVADSQGGARARFRIGFDEERFRTAFAESPELVEQLFTDEEGGVGAVIRETLEGMTRSFDGVISRRDDLLQDRQELLNDRITAGERLLESKRAMLREV